jgi:transposase
MRRLPVSRHRTANQVRAEYRACRDGVEKTRWHVIWLLLRTDEPRTPARVAEVVGASVVRARSTLRRWNEHGPEGLTDRRTANRGRPKLSDDQRAKLFATLKKRPPDGGLWSGPKVARFAAVRWGVVVRPETGWRWLRTLGFTLQVPRPSHPRAAHPPTQKQWKKTCAGA